MFAKAERLTSKKLYDTLFKRGQWYRGKWFSLITLPIQRVEHGKIGFIVTKKTLRAATARNRAKRQVRHAFRVVFQSPKYNALGKSHHIIVLLHRAVDDLSFIDLKTEVERKLNSVNSSGKTEPKPRKS
jgi:ribonuclease P protein component